MRANETIWFRKITNASLKLNNTFLQISNTCKLLGSQKGGNLGNGNVVLGSRLLPFHPHDGWKWICHLPCLLQLRTKTNTFIVSLAVADFCVGLIAVLSPFVCNLANCNPPNIEGWLVLYIRIFIVCASGSNLLSLVLERYIAVVKPLKYLTFVTRRRVTQMVVISWVIPLVVIVVAGRSKEY